MRKILITIVIAATVTSLVGCNSSAPTPNQDTANTPVAEQPAYEYSQSVTQSSLQSSVYSSADTSDNSSSSSANESSLESVTQSVVENSDKEQETVTESAVVGETSSIEVTSSVTQTQQNEPSTEISRATGL